MKYQQTTYSLKQGGVRCKQYTSFQTYLQLPESIKSRIIFIRCVGVVMKRAQYFLTANGRMADGLRFTQDSLLRNLIAVEQSLLPQPEMRQLSLFDDAV